MTSPLIGVDELAELLVLNEPMVLLDASFQLGNPEFGRRAHTVAHLPGALFVDVEELFSGPVREDRRGGRHPLPDSKELQEGLRSLGLDDDTRVVVYDQGPMMGAARVWWVLRDAGMGDVRVLRGGLQAWLEAGHPVTDQTGSIRVGTVTLNPGQLPQLDAQAVAEHIAAGGRVVDVRTAPRFRGEDEPIDPVAGHIPGAVNLPAGELPSRVQELREGDVLSCGSGITAAHAVLLAEDAGIAGLAIYPGSWSDWISDPERPVATD